MTVLTCASTGKSITLLGEPIANSGKGKVLRTNHNGYLAKIYHSQTPERVQKSLSINCCLVKLLFRESG